MQINVLIFFLMHLFQLNSEQTFLNEFSSSVNIRNTTLTAEGAPAKQMSLSEPQPQQPWQHPFEAFPLESGERWCLTRNNREPPELMNDIYEKPSADIRLSGEIVSAFPLWIWPLEVLGNVVRQVRGKKKDWKEINQVNLLIKIHDCVM